MKPLNLLMLVLSSFGAMTLEASVKEGHGPGNGGHAVELNRKLYLLDLAEAGVQDAPLQDVPYLDSENDRYMKRAEWFMKDHLPREINDSIRAHVARRVGFLSPMERNLLLGVLPLYSWRMVDLPLVPLRGIRSTLDLSKINVYQAAVRRDSVILLSKTAWERMDDWNRAGLIVHELIYATIRPLPLPDGTFHQESWDARMIVGDLFSERPRAISDYTRDGDFTSTLAMKSDAWGESTETISMGFSPTPRSIGLTYRPGVTISKTLGEDGMFFFFGRDWADSWRQGVRDACMDIMLPYWGKKAFLSNRSDMATLNLSDYMTAEGPTKYVRLSHSVERNRSVTRASPDGTRHTSPGHFSLSYSRQSECEADLPGKIQILRDEIFRSYDFK